MNWQQQKNTQFYILFLIRQIKVTAQLKFLGMIQIDQQNILTGDGGGGDGPPDGAWE